MNENMKLSKRCFLKTLAVGGLSLTALDQLPAAALGNEKRPNIIFMLTDDLGFGDVGCYGCKDIKTPNIDKLAKEGVMFTDAYAAAPVCSPTRVAFVSGRYQQRCGHSYEDYIGAGSPGLDPKEHRTIAMYLKEAGYKTACSGKWNVGGGEFMPPVHGFDHWIGMDHNHNYFSHLGYNHKERNWTGEQRLWENDKQVDIKGYTTDILGNFTVKYIEENDGKTPFFIYLPWQAPHSPLQPPDAKYENADEVASAPKGTSPEMRPDYIKIVERLDYQIGRIMAVLKRKGLDKNTLVIFTSDNGGHRAARNLPLKGYKQDLDEGGIRVPFIMRQPGVIPFGQITSQPAITMDITATIATAAGVKIQKDRALDGIDLMPYATGKKPADINRTLYWRRRTVQFNTSTDKVRAKAIREGDWKYLNDIVRGKEHLYNLKDDIGETNNLLMEKPEIAARLKKKLEVWEAEVTPERQPLFPESKKKQG